MSDKLQGMLFVAALLLVAFAGCNRSSPTTGAASLAVDDSTVTKRPGSERPVEPPAVEKPPAAAPAATKDITFDDLKFEHVKGSPFDRSMLTPAVNKLVDKPVRIRGYIFPTFQQSGIKQFVLVRDNMSCCFGPGAALFDCIVVDMVDGTSADFSVLPISVEGVFKIHEIVGGEGNTLAVYHLDAKEAR